MPHKIGQQKTLATTRRAAYTAKPPMEQSRYKIEIEGTVQGIGFRPFVYKTAVKHGIKGFVLNNSNGVVIEAEGPETDIAGFVETVLSSPPPFAQILSSKREKIGLKRDREFRIIKSDNLGKANTLISPDIATCNDCLSDIGNPDNRRYRYAFTNCTNCGPRYTIIEGVPYDRPYTAMKRFEMCPHCSAEYGDPLDRRYHAQPNACPACGPALELVENASDEGVAEGGYQGCHPCESRDPEHSIALDSCLRRNDKPSAITSKGSEEVEDSISKTVQALKEGKIVAIKGLGGFHLACDATDESAVKRLRARKMRDEKPFAVMMPDVCMAKKHCEIGEAEEELLTSPQRPIVLLKKRKGIVYEGAKIAEAVAPANCYLGVMLPYTPLHHLLLNETPALVMTSANLTDEPICYKNGEAMERLKGVADYFLIHNRDIYMRTDDSIARVMDGKPVLQRRARGYVPQPVILKTLSNPHQILAVGPELKNTVCLLKDNKAFISQHIGDLENTAAFESFENAIEHLKKLFDIKPAIIAHDMHPDYFSSVWAKNQAADKLLIPVQHHHAHIASCMAENHIEGPVIGIALDGTGYGTDGNIWGGELLVASYKGFERAGQFEYVPMPGGIAAVKNPWQMALSYLYKSEIQIKDQIPSFREIQGEKIALVLQMLETGINSPLTSSCGRLFDAVAAIIGLTNHVSYEGQAAFGLEGAVTGYRLQVTGFKRQDGYRYKIVNNNDYITISYRDTIKDILDDIHKGLDKPEIAYRFHMTIVNALTKSACFISERTGIREITLSGGCFQNAILTETLKKSLEDKGLSTYTHSLIPPNDGGVSLGQAAVARARAVDMEV